MHTKSMFGVLLTWLHAQAVIHLVLHHVEKFEELNKLGRAGWDAYNLNQEDINVAEQWLQVNFASVVTSSPLPPQRNQCPSP